MGALFRQQGPMVLRRALRLLGNQQDAEEALQEVFIRVMRGADGFEERSSVTTWLYQITTNYCLNYLRNRARRLVLSRENAEVDLPAEPVSAADLLFLRRLLAEADEQQAQAAVYIYMDGMSHEEAAELLGVSRRTVGNLIERFLTWAHDREARSAAVVDREARAAAPDVAAVAQRSAALPEQTPRVSNEGKRR